jgi:hypothetical protein
VATKPLIGTVLKNVRTHGTGALNIDGCRVGTDGGWKRNGDRIGRWPSNVILSGDPGALAGFAVIKDDGDSAARFFKQFGPEARSFLYCTKASPGAQCWV